MDGRKNNGNKGHSTKTTGADKRKNSYRDAIKEAFTGEDIVDVLKTTLIAAKNGDIQAAKLFLEFTVSKPTESLDVSTNNNTPIIIMKSDKKND